MEVACPHCGKKYHVLDTAVGKQARCGNPNCKQVFIVGATEAQGSPAAPAPPQWPAAPSQPQRPAASLPPKPKAAPPQPSVVPKAPPQPPAPAPWADVPEPGPPVPPPSAPPPLGPAPSLLDDLLGADLAGAPGVAPLTPVAAARPARRRRGFPKPLVYGAAAALAVVAVAVLAYYVVTSGGGSGGGAAAAASAEWARPFLPGNAMAVGYLNADKLRKSELAPLFNRLLRGRMGAAEKAASRSGASIPGGGFGIPRELTELLDLVTEVHFASLREDQAVVVVRTREDVPLDRMVALAAKAQEGQAAMGLPAGPPLPAGAETRTAGSVSYVKFGNGWLAKPAANTFCGATREEDMKEALGRWERKETAPYGAEMQRALQSVKGDSFVAVDARLVELPGGVFGSGLGGRSAGFPSRMPSPGTSGAGPAAEDMPKWFALGFSADSWLSIDAAAAFAGNAQAEAIQKQFDDGMKMLDTKMGSIPANVPREARQQIEKITGMVRAIKLSRSGDTIRVTGRWRIKDLEELANQAKGMMPGMPF